MGSWKNKEKKCRSSKKDDKNSTRGSRTYQHSKRKRAIFSQERGWRIVLRPCTQTRVAPSSRRRRIVHGVAGRIPTISTGDGNLKAVTCLPSMPKPS
ncbi:unnamed protein product [Sphagnum balticum]